MRVMVPAARIPFDKHDHPKGLLQLQGPLRMEKERPNSRAADCCALSVGHQSNLEKPREMVQERTHIVCGGIAVYVLTLIEPNLKLSSERRRSPWPNLIG